jgi:hypothetical protein
MLLLLLHTSSSHHMTHKTHTIMFIILSNVSQGITQHLNSNCDMHSKIKNKDNNYDKHENCKFLPVGENGFQL